MAKKTSKELIVVNCTRCSARVSGTVEGQFNEHLDEAGFTVRWSLLKCPTCFAAILIAQDDEAARYGGSDDGELWADTRVLYPVNKRRELGAAVPEPIRTAFGEARTCFDDARAYTACAIMCRKVLEGICDSHGAKRGSLAQRLKSLADQGVLDKRLYEWIDTLRVVGNEAVHDVSVTVSKEDAADLLELAEAVAEYLYTFKEKYDAFQSRRLGRTKQKKGGK